MDTTIYKPNITASYLLFKISFGSIQNFKVVLLYTIYYVYILHIYKKALIIY